jgi:hypothetical protein
LKNYSEEVNAMKAAMQREKIQHIPLTELSMICQCALRVRPDRTQEEDDTLINQLAAVMREALNVEIIDIGNVTLFHSFAAVAQVALEVAAQIDEAANIAASAVDPTYLM